MLVDSSQSLNPGANMMTSDEDFSAMVSNDRN